jgi:hypothetical protein
MAGVTDPLNWTLDAIGDIPGSIEMKLIDFEEALSLDKQPTTGRDLHSGRQCHGGLFRKSRGDCPIFVC